MGMGLLGRWLARRLGWVSGDVLPLFVRHRCFYGWVMCLLSHSGVSRTFLSVDFHETGNHFSISQGRGVIY
jgi:hypothetical protein